MIIENVEDKNPSDKEGCTPLHWAVQEGHLEISKILLEEVKDKNPRDNNVGETPLHLGANVLPHATLSWPPPEILVVPFNFYLRAETSDVIIEHV